MTREHVNMCHASNKTLIDRANMLAAVRSFFSARSVLEVDTALLTPTPPIDPYIDIFHVPTGGYLHSSPEYGMKKILARGIGDIYQLSHVFRKGEKSPRHSFEFTMIEWYRHTLSFEELMDECKELCSLFLGPVERVALSYDDAFKRATGVSRADANYGELLKKHGIDTPETNPLLLEDLLWGLVVEPIFDPEKLTFITMFPSEKAALAKVENGKALRFECYYRGNELANGYKELQTAEEYAERLLYNNSQRETPLPFPSDFITALGNGLPPVVGVAVGFDRLMMLRHKKDLLSEVLP